MPLLKVVNNIVLDSMGIAKSACDYLFCSGRELHTMPLQSYLKRTVSTCSIFQDDNIMHTCHEGSCEGVETVTVGTLIRKDSGGEIANVSILFGAQAETAV